MTADETTSPAHPRCAAAHREPALDVEIRRFPDETRTARQATA